ncbi:hypothetical protein PV797_09240 [Clostridiaceae bacterium M8S5]|nr:hypothetical protein PV797_09240 [Clostridiaceae bacterium M8S5]
MIVQNKAILFIKNLSLSTIRFIYVGMLFLIFSFLVKKFSSIEAIKDTASIIGFSIMGEMVVYFLNEYVAEEEIPVIGKFKISNINMLINVLVLMKKACKILFIVTVFVSILSTLDCIIGGEDSNTAYVFLITITVWMCIGKKLEHSVSLLKKKKES